MATQCRHCRRKIWGYYCPYCGMENNEILNIINEAEKNQEVLS